MAIKGGFDANDIAAQILSALDAVEDAGVKKAEDIGVSIGQAVRDGIVEGSKGLESEIGKTYKQFQNFVRAMNRSADGLKLDKWKKGLGLAESLMKDEKYAHRVAEALKDVQATFNGTKVSGLENVLREFAKNSKALQSISVPQVKSSGTKTSNKPKVETPVVQSDPTPVVKAEGKKQKAIADTTATIAKQGEAIEQVTKKAINMAHAIRRYNKLMEDLGNDDSTTDRYYDSSGEGAAKRWTLKDMVSRARMHLDTYNQEGHANYELKNESDFGRKMWESETKKLQRFINRYEPYVDLVQTTVGDVQQATTVTKEQTEALQQQASAIDTAAETINKQNQISISSYQDLYAALEKVVNLSRQLKPEYTAEYSDMYEMVNKAGYPDSKESLIASIKAQYDNVQRIKASIKNGLSVYKDIDGDGYEATYNIDNNTLKNAENMLHGYIYQAVEYFGYSVSDVMNDFDKKRIRTFVEKEINKYLEVSSKNDEYRMDAEAFNAPIRDAIESITDTIINMATDAKSNERVFDSLAELKSRPEDVNRYTLSTQANHIGSNIGLSTPYSEIQANAKKIESYEELCELVARYNELQKRNAIFGGTEHAGLDEAEEMELRRLKARLEATGGKDIYKLSDWGRFDNVDKLADAMGLIDKKAEEAQKEIEAAYLEAEQFVAKCKEIQNQEIFDGIDCDKLISDLSTVLAKLKEIAEQRDITFGAYDPEWAFEGVKSHLESRKRISEALKEGVVYHAGVLGDVGHTMKSIPLGNVEPHRNADRTFNGFTGLYTTEDVDGFWANEWEGAPISTIDISHYKLFDAKNNELAGKAQDFFNNLNSTIYGYHKFFDHESGEMKTSTDVKSVEELYDDFKEVFKGIDLDFESFRNFVTRSKAIVEGHSFETIETPDLDQGITKSYSSAVLQGVSQDVFNSDSFQTQLLKMLGFEGIDLRSTKFNGTYTGGTVIFDVKPESIKATDEKWSDVMARHGYEIDEASLAREEKRRQLAFDTAKAYSQQADAAKEVADASKGSQKSGSDLLNDIADSQNEAWEKRLKKERAEKLQAQKEAEEANARADMMTMQREGKAKGQAYARDVYHGSGEQLNDVIFDPKIGNGLRRFGLGAYFTEELDKAAQFGDNIVKKSVDLKNVFMLTKDMVSDLDDLYAAMGKVKPENVDYKTAMDDLSSYLLDMNNIEPFTNRMKKMGYDGMFAQDGKSKELVVYDEKYWQNWTTSTVDEIKKQLEQKEFKETEKTLQDVLDLAKKMASDSGDVDAFNTRHKALLDGVNDLMSGIDYDQAYDQLIANENKYQQELEETARIQKERDGQLEAFSYAAVPFMSDDKYEAVDANDKTKLFESFVNKIAEDGMSASDAMDQLYLSMEALRKQSEAMPDDVIENFGGSKEQVTETVSQLQKLSSVDLTRIFDSVDLKEFLKMFNIDSSNFATFRILFEELMQITKAMGDGVDVGSAFDAKMAEITDTIMRLGGHMVDLDDSGYTTMMQDFYKYMSKTKVQFNSDIKSEYSDDWKTFYRTNKNRLTSDPTKGIAADSLYQELHEKWPSLFPENLSQQEDFKRIFEKLDEARQLQANNWKVLQGFVSSDRNNIQGNVDELYNKMSDALYVGNEIESSKDKADVSKNLSDIQDDVNEQSDELEQQIAAAEQAKANLDRAFQNVKQASSRAILKGQTKKDFEDFAKQIADDSGMELGTVAVARDNMDQMRLATIKLINKELAQSITYTYDIQENAEGVNEAFLRSSYAVGDANKALENLRNKEKQNAKKKLQDDTWLYAQRGKLDTQQRQYTDPDRGIDGKLSIMSVETSLAEDAEHTIENLANHIRENIKKSLSGGLTDEVKRKIISDLEILENEIKVRQKEAYSSTTMKSSHVEVNKKAYQAYLRAFKANAQKSGVFPKMESTIADLNSELNAVSDSNSFSKFVDNFKVARNKFQAEVAELSRDTKTLQKQLSTLNGEESAHGKIFANIRSVGYDNLGDSFKQKIAVYESALRDLRAAMDSLKANPADVSGNLHRDFDDAALKAKNARVEIEGIFKQSQKLEQISRGTFIGSYDLDADELKNLQQAMLSFAASMEDGTFKFKGFNKAGTEMYGTLEQSSGAIKDVTVALKSSSDQLYMYGMNANRADNEWEDFKTTLASGTKNLVGMYVGFQEGVQAIRSGVEAVKEIDLAMTELKKVTDETDDSYKEFLEDAGRTSAVIGSTVSDFTEASAIFARLGYSLDEASSMAETAIIYKNVADGLDTVEEASDSIISTMMAFGIEANDTMSIIDRFNAVGNSFAITSAGIGEALQRSASALFSAGNTIDESVALVTTANSVIQNPEQVGTALKTLALRLRGAKVELEEAGLETDSMAESTSKLQAQLKALTHGKVDIMLDADTFKSTTQILREMSEAWEDMTDIERASALELMGGKRQANILASVITNFQTVEDVIATSMNSAGSAMEENEKYLDSIQGRIDIFNNSLQTFWNNVISSDVTKWVVDRGTDTINILDTTTGKVLALASAIHLITKFKGINISGVFQGLQKSIEQINKAKTTLNALTFKDTTNGKFKASDIAAYASAVSALTPKIQAQALAASGLNEIQIKNALSTNQVSEKNIKLAMTQVHTKKTTQQLATVTGEMAQTILTSQGITLSSTATDFLKEHSTEQVTEAMIDQMIARGALDASEKSNIMTALGLTGANHGLAASFNAVGTAISFAFKSNPLGFILSLVPTIMAAIPVVTGLADAFTDSAEEIKEKAQEISNAYSTAIDEVNNNFKKLDIDDNDSIAELTKEFESLTAGVDRYGNNISLTSDQYSRYKEICEQIVGINPRIASGYDSATEAIGNNASALSQLIEFQKERARLAAEEYVNDDNLETLTEDEVNDYKDAQKQRGKVVGKRNELFGMLSQGSTKDTMEYILRTLGYGEAEIANEISRYYLNEINDYDSNLFMMDFVDEIDKKYKNFDGHVDELDKFFDEYKNTIHAGEQSIEEAQNGLIDKLLIVPTSSKDYDKLTSEGKNFLTDWINDSEIFKMDESTTAEDVQDMRDTILDMMDILVDEVKTVDYNGEMLSAQDILGQIYNLDPSSVNYEDYKAQISAMLEAFWNSLSQDQKDQYGFTDFENFKISFGFDFETEDSQIETAKNQVAGFLDMSITEIQERLNGMTAAEIKAFYSIDWNEVGKDGVGSWQDVVKQVRASVQGNDTVTVKTYSALTESVESYNDILTQTSEIVSNNTEVTQEYKDSLTALGISEAELNECFDENNGLVVKNTTLLRKLVAQKKQERKATIQASKSLGQAQYKNTVKQLQQVIKAMALEIKASGYVSDVTLHTASALREQLVELKRTIQQYALLELSLTDAANAYTEFEEAKERDEQLTYGDSMIEMLELINDGFKTGKVGSEAFQAAVKALVPESVYKDIDDLEKRMIAIHDYIDKDEKFADYFTIDDGEFSVTFDNIKAFIKDCQDVGLFTGTDAGDFELNPNFNMSDDTVEKIETLNGVLKEYQETYGGTVDLVNRKKIDITSDNIDTVRNWGMDVNVGDYMTVASQTYGDGNAAIVVTPILPNGELMEQDELDAYIKDVISKANAGSGNYADYDTKGILMGVFDDADTWEENLEKADEFAMEVHGIHEVLNALGGSGVATLKDFADALGITESAALAMLTELEKYDASWGNIITDLTTSPLDREINNATDALEKALEEQEEFIRSGESLNGDEYKEICDNVNDARAALDNATAAAARNAQQGSYVEAVYSALAGEIKLTEEQAMYLVDALNLIDDNGDLTVTINDDGSIALTDTQLQTLKLKAEQLASEPSIMDVQLRYDDIIAQIDELQSYIDGELEDPDNSEILKTLQIDGTEEAQQKLDELTKERDIIQLTYNITTTTSEQQSNVMEQLATWETNGVTISINANSEGAQAEMDAVDAREPKDKEVSITADGTEANAEIDSVDNNNISDKEPLIDVQGTSTALSEINSVDDALDDLPSSKTIKVNVKYNTTGQIPGGTPSGGGTVANGNFHVFGDAFANGTIGAPKTETALVGELGPEMLVRNGRWTTVGENGAEFTQIKKGDIIFNHKQTEDLLSKGYVTGRGKAYASGTVGKGGPAYYGVVGPYVGDEDAFKNGSDKWMNPWTNTSNAISDAADSLSDSADSISDASDEFREVFDWIEIRLEEINEDISLKNAKLENAVGSNKQNAIVDDMIKLNQALYNNLIAGSKKYYSYASKLLAKVPAAYRDAAQDGTIAIEEFVGEVDEKTLEAIQEYREWVQKGDEAVQQAEETLTEISSLAKQAIDNIAADYDNKTSLRDNKIDQYEAYNSLLETDVGYESASIYQAMIKENNKNIATLEKQRDKMQAELNAQVESGNIKKYSQDWYDAVNDIAAVDTEIINLKTDTENWQDAINELHWDKFDALMSRLEVVSEETENLIDILGNKDLVDDSGNWTDEGITTLGLYAQQMEAAEVQAKKYQEEIDYLNANWQKLGYTEEEYLEKLEELKSGQYDAIDSYHDAKDAIADLNQERIDAIKDGIEKEIEAYEKLIEAKKEELDAEKDLYDFQKSIMEQQKDVADLERQLAALSGDNSASARAKRAQLEAELAEARAALEESYYERSVSNQQEALDKELENFQEEKNQEMESWDEYLENTEQVVADSLATVQANTDAIYQTLQEMGQEYGLSITESLTSPWREGETAIQSFSEQFGISMSATVEELQELELEFLATMAEIEQAGIDAANSVKENAQGYTDAEYKEPEKKEEKPKDNGDKKQEEKKIKVGGKINAKGAKIYDYVGDKSGSKQYYSSDPIYVVLDEKSGYLKVRHHKSKSGVTGWFKKSDVKAYAKGSFGVSEDQWALIDELGDELQLIPGKNGRLEYVKKGTGIVPADLTERLVNLAMDPQEMLDRNRPSVGVHPEIHHTEINIDNSVGELIHIDNCSTETLPDVKKIVDDALEKHMQKLNNSLRKYTR